MYKIDGELQAVGEICIIKPITEQTTRSGIIELDDGMTPTRHGYIISVGTDADDGVLKKGQRVIYHRPGEWLLDVEDYVWVKYEHILAIYND